MTPLDFVKWDTVSAETVCHCWQHIGFLFPGLQTSTLDVCSQDFGNLFERISIIMGIPSTDLLSPTDFIEMDSYQETERDLDDTELLLCTNYTNECSQEEELNASLAKPTLQEAKAASEIVVRYFESEDGSLERLSSCFSN